MKKILSSAALAVLTFVGTPATAPSPPAQPNAPAKIYKPLQIRKDVDLDFGTIVLVGTSFTGEVVTVPISGPVVCGSGGGNLTCGGAPTAAKFHLTGSNNAMVTVTSPPFSLGGPATLNVAPTSTTQNVGLGAAGLTTGVDVFLGGSISLDASTPDGVYTGIWTVTADYQ